MIAWAMPEDSQPVLVAKGDAVVVEDRELGLRERAGEAEAGERRAGGADEHGLGDEALHDKA